jgi:hypothetical protein
VILWALITLLPPWGHSEGATGRHAQR